MELKGARVAIYIPCRPLSTRIAEQFQHQGIADLKQVFEGLSCGLVRILA
jgi:hypothetical protein